MREQASHPHTSHGTTPRRGAADELRERILQAIEDYWQEHGRPPTIREICAQVHVESTSHVAYHVSILKRQGRVSHEPGSRGLKPTRPTGLPVLGTIAAGTPIDLFDGGDPETLSLSEIAPAIRTVPTNAGQDIFALRVRGTSMIEDGILDGDYVVIARGQTALDGEIAVATHNTANGGRGEATLKRVYRSDGGVILQPANAELKPRFIPANEWQREWTVQGTLVAVYRQYAPLRTAAPHL